MRFDEINIIGEFKINGLTGSPGQALGLSGSEFTWITVSASSVIDAVLLTGTDYVICQSVNTGNPGTDAIENGNRLKSAYATASALYMTNRVSVLITPGDYDFGATPLQLTTTKVDLIGMSSDASDVILRGSGDYVLQIINSNTDTALCNVTLDGTSTTLHSFDNSGTNSCYLRWDNVIATGNIFTDDDVSSYTDLNGDFKNIKVYSSPYAFYTLNGNIDGVYDNIELTDITYGFYSNGGFLLGTYSNITLSGTLDSIFNTGGFEMIATFENIKCGNVNGNIFTSYGLNGKFRNIEIGDVGSSILYSALGDLDGTFENIKMGNVSQNALSTNTGNLTGTFSNIEIGDCTNAFYCQTSGTVSGTYQNIEIGIVSGNLFYTDDGSFQGTYNNIKILDISNAFTTFVGDINGVFENIEIGNITGDLFYTDNGSIQGTYKNIKTGDINGNALRARIIGNIDGIFTDIEVGNVGGLFIEGSILRGNFSNIKVGDGGVGSRRFEAGQIDVVLDLLEVGNCTSVFSSSGTVSGTYSNIQIGNVTDVFESNFNLTGTYENIKIGTCSNAFVSTTSDINGYFDTIEIGDASNSVFYSNSYLYGTYKNIKMGDVTNYVFYASVTIDGIFDNIKFSNCSFFLKVDAGFIYGTYSNITGLNVATNLISTGSDFIGSMKNCTFEDVGNFGGSIYDSTFENLNFKGSLYMSSSRIFNSTIDARGLSQPALGLNGGGVVERCKFLSDTDIPSINSTGPINAQISFTITNYGITSSITNDISTPLNINNSNIT